MSDQSTLSGYFGGDAKDLGKVRLQEARSFSKLVHASLNLATVLNVTRSEFRQMPKKVRDEKKRSPYLTPASFKVKSSKRHITEARFCNLIFLDIDDPKAARPYWANPQTLEEALAPFSFAVYTTANSTSAAPRIRIMVDADEIPLRAYPDAVKTIAMMIGLPSVTLESIVTVQPMFLPVIFKDDDPELDHPVLWSYTVGSKFTEDDIQSDVLGTLVEPRTQGKNNSSQSSASNLDDMDFLRSPVEEVTLEIAEQALNKLDPDMGYMDWLAVACSLRHQFFGLEEEEAYQLFDAWSAKGEKYASAKDTAAKWKAIRPNVAGRPPVTIRTLLHKAVEAGWDAGPLAKLCFDKTEAWINDSTRTVKELFTKGVALIAATPLLSTSEEEILLNKLLDKGKKLNAKTSIAVLRKELKKMKRDMAAKADDKEKTPKWTRGVVYVSGLNEFFRQATGERLTPEAADNRWGKHLLGETQDDTPSAAEGSKPIMRPRDFLLNVIQVPDVYDYLYDPRNPNDSIVTRDKVSYINTYIRDHPEPDYETQEKAGKMFKDHLLTLIENPVYVETLLDYLCYMVQHPGKKIRWSVLLQGAEGCGKTLISQVMETVLGQRNCKAVDASILFGSSFNDWAVGAQLVTLEEVRVVGHNRHEVMNKLKPCISNNVISVNKKYRDVMQMDNVTNYIMYTNHHDSLAIGEGSRRYFVLQSRIQTKEQVKDLGENYFKRFFKMLAKDGAGLRAWFETRTISPSFDPNGHAPQTVFLNELIDAAASNDMMTMRQMIEDSSNPLVCKELICSKTLLQMLEVEANDIGGQQLAAMLREEGYKSCGRRHVHDSRRTLWIKHKSSIDQAELWHNVRALVDGEIDAEDFRILTF